MATKSKKKKKQMLEVVHKRTTHESEGLYIKRKLIEKVTKPCAPSIIKNNNDDDDDDNI